MNSSASKYLRFKSKSIKFNNYTYSLIDEAVKSNIINLSEEEALREKTDKLFADCIALYEGDNGEAPIDVRRDIMSAAIFNVDVSLMNSNDHYKALEALVYTDMRTLYDDGLKQIKMLMFEVTNMLVKVRRSRVELPCALYNYTIDEEIKQILKNYEPKYFSHKAELPGYPLVVNEGGAVGVHLIKKYLMNLYAENQFCNEYSSEELGRLYSEYCKKYGLSEKDASVNIYTIVYPNAIFADYLKKEHGVLSITEDDCKLIEKLLGSLSESEQRDILRGLSARLNLESRTYNAKALIKLFPEINKAISEKKLASYLTVY